MKKTLITILLLICTQLVFSDKYVAEVVTEASGSYSVGDVISSYIVPDEATITAPVFEITQAEYASGNIDQGKIDAALVIAQDNSKDFSMQFNKLLKAFALCVLDEINVLRTNAGLSERTTAQLKTAVKNKYNTL